LKNLPPTPVETLDRVREVALEAGLKYVYIGNVPGHPGNNTYCPHDGRLLVERKGDSLLQYHIIDGRCQFCGERIPGVWNGDS